MFLSVNNNSSLNQQQQQNQVRINVLPNQQQNVQTSMAQSTPGGMQQTSNPSQVMSQSQAVTSQAQVKGCGGAVLYLKSFFFCECC